jgi:hypothetical protein
MLRRILLISQNVEFWAYEVFPRNPSISMILHGAATWKPVIFILNAHQRKFV